MGGPFFRLDKANGRNGYYKSTFPSITSTEYNLSMGNSSKGFVGSRWVKTSVPFTVGADLGNSDYTWNSGYDTTGERSFNFSVANKNLSVFTWALDTTITSAPYAVTYNKAAHNMVATATTKTFAAGITYKDGYVISGETVTFNSSKNSSAIANSNKTNAGTYQARVKANASVSNADRVAYKVNSDSAEVAWTINKKTLTPNWSAVTDFTYDATAHNGSTATFTSGASANNDGKYYTLSGQEVEKPTAGGIYIHNGRKFVVK